MKKHCTPKIRAAGVTIKLGGSYANTVAVYCPLRRKITTAAYENFFDQLGTRWITGGICNTEHITGALTLSHQQEGISANYTNNVVDLSSDHVSVTLTISSTIVKKHRRIHLTSEKKKNWEEFRNVLNEEIDLRISIKSKEELDTAAEAMLSVIQKAAKEATPENTRDTDTRSNIF